MKTPDDTSIRIVLIFQHNKFTMRTNTVSKPNSKSANEINVVLGILIATTVLVAAGCQSLQDRNDRINFGNSQRHANYEAAIPSPNQSANVAHDIYANPMINPAAFDNAAPRTTSSGLPQSFYELTLDEALRIGLQDTRVLRSLNAQVLANPDSVASALDPAIQESNPVFGTAAALAQFDARFQSSVNWTRNDDVFNNVFLGGGSSEVQQDLGVANWNVSKTTATGTAFSLGSQVQHDNNDGSNNLFDHSWRTQVEASVRQPLLQGRGVEFNRIAGPNARPGFRFSTGLLVSQLNYSVSVSEFEQGIREYVSNVVSAYWDLYFSYRNFSAALAARDNAYETWQSVKSRFESELTGGEADAEAQAREQYYLFQQQVNEALGSSSRGTNGVLQAEANLRRLIGLPQNDGQFMRPVDEPLNARLAYEWDHLLYDSLSSRVEIRQQMQQVRRREMELFAARNFTKPRLDAVATYRNNGFGDDLAGDGPGRFSSALNDATTFDHDEWEVGLQYDVPVGFRQAHAGVRHAELNLQRERVVLSEQSKQIVHNLGSAYRQLDNSFTSLHFAGERYAAARKTVEARTAAYDEDLSSVVDLLEAHRILGNAEIDYYRARQDYTNANYSVLRESGRLLRDLAVLVDDQSQGYDSCGVTGPSAIDYRY